MSFDALLETFRLWLSPVVLLAILGVITRHYATVRKADTADRALNVQAESSIRDAYAAAVRGFREEVAALKAAQHEELEYVKAKLRECEQHREGDRDRISALRDYAEGLNRVIIANSAAGVLRIDSSDGYVSDEVRRAAERVDQLFKKDRAHGKPSG